MYWFKLFFYKYIRKIEFIIYRDDSDIFGVEEFDMVLSVRCYIKYLNSFMDLFEYVKWFFYLRKKNMFCFFL